MSYRRVLMIYSMVLHAPLITQYFLNWFYHNTGTLSNAYRQQTTTYSLKIQREREREYNKIFLQQSKISKEAILSGQLMYRTEIRQQKQSTCGFALYLLYVLQLQQSVRIQLYKNLCTVRVLLTVQY